MIPRGQ